MYYFLFILYIILSTCVGLWGFFWALRNGQFRDQQRARYLPLLEEHENPAIRVSKSHLYQAYALFGILVSALIAAAAVVIYALVRGG